MQAKPFVTVRDYFLTYDKKHKLPIVRFNVDYGFLPDNAVGEDDLFNTTMEGCLLSFGGGEEAQWTPSMNRIGWHYKAMTKVSPRWSRLVMEALRRSGVVKRLKTEVDDWRRIYWGAKDPLETIFQSSVIDLKETKVTED